MDSFYLYSLIGLGVGCAAVELSKARQRTEVSPEYNAFRNNYLAVYCMMMAGDWLQGPYVYALYEGYGFSVGDIGKLFIAGFLSSLIFGTVVGSLADRYGRKAFALLYVALYAASCATKHSPSFHVLMLGRVLGGTATSLLFSVFESWLCGEHRKRQYSDEWLASTFSRAALFGSGLCAIVSGFVGSALVAHTPMGLVAPFDAAAAVLLLGGAVIHLTWPENYGSDALLTEKQDSIFTMVADSVGVVLGDPAIALLGATQALFEGSMYSFVFLWTPALSPAGERIPHGLVFAAMMMSCMAGSSAVTVLLTRRVTVTQYMPWVFLASAAALGVCVPLNVVSATPAADGGITMEGKLQMAAFCVFEFCVGMFWPSMMSMRATLVPDSMRSTIINLFRIPLNIFVCVVLYNVASVPLSLMFGLCASFMFLCYLMQRQLNPSILARA